MSREGFLITCTNCSYSGSDLVVDGLFYYLMPFGKANVPRALGWCFECGTVSPVEVISYKARMDSLSGLLNKTKLEINKHEKTGGGLRKIKKILFDIPESSEAESLSRLREIEEYLRNEVSSPTYLLPFLISNRPPRCLVCGSEKVETLPNIYESIKESNKHMDRGFKIGFKHPSCRGDLKASKSGVRFNLRHEEKNYSMDGIKVN